MNRRILTAALVLSAPALTFWAAGCGDDEVISALDGGGFEGSLSPESGIGPTPEAGADSAPPSTCGDSTGAPARLLLSMNNASTSELVAYNIADKKVDGRLTYPGFIGLTSSLGADPYLLEEAHDTVARLDAKNPFSIISSWNVAGDDAKDGGAATAEPVAIVVPDCTKGYVLRYNRNKIAVIDTTKAADGGAPDSFIDLGTLLGANDPDGTIDMTAALYVPSKKRIYVLLGNIDSTKYTAAFDLLCSASKPSIIAIDTTTSQIVSLNGTGKGGGIELSGYNPPLGTPLLYDAARDRLLVLSGGCNVDNAGVAGAIQQRQIEEVDLSTGIAKTLLALNANDFPTGMVFIDGNRAAVTFAGPFFGALGSAYFWDPSQTTLGANIPGGFDYPAYDGQGNLVGMRTSKLDGGAGPIEVISVPFTDAGAIDASTVTKLGENPFTDNTGFISATEIWPHP
jgi:hypothetical protein